MSLLKYLKVAGFKKPSSAQIAKERLQIIIRSERDRPHNDNFIHELQRELIEVISKYLPIDPNQVNIDLQQVGGVSVLELNIVLPKTLSHVSEEDFIATD